jgi:hypothetical protein
MSIFVVDLMGVSSGVAVASGALNERRGVPLRIANR